MVEALRAKRPLERILVARGLGGARVQEVIELARQSGTPVRFEERDALDRLASTRAHQGVIALGAAKQYAELEDVAPASALIVVLDGVEDPHNLGALIRTADGAGVDGVVIPERRAAPVNATVAKTSAGAPVASLNAFRASSPPGVRAWPRSPRRTGPAMAATTTHATTTRHCRPRRPTR